MQNSNYEAPFATKEQVEEFKTEVYKLCDDIIIKLFKHTIIIFSISFFMIGSFVGIAIGLLK